jgi:hypothetical protein
MSRPPERRGCSIARSVPNGGIEHSAVDNGSAIVTMAIVQIIPGVSRNERSAQ